MKRKILITVATICIVALIIDTESAILGAQEGISICLKSIIPSLLPFCILTKIISDAIIGKPIWFMQLRYMIQKNFYFVK